MRTHRRALASATLAAVATTGLVMAARPDPVRATVPPATAALQYLASFQTANGAVDASFGSGITEDTLIGMADNGFDPSTLVSSAGHSAYGYLAANVQSETHGSGSTVSPGGTAKLILAVVAGHLDPTAFGGVDLVSLLSGTVSSGSFGASPSTFTQSLGILAEVAAGHAVPPGAIGVLTGMQAANGAWGTTSFTPNGETNSTALALMALGAAGVSVGTLAHDPLAYLKTQQAPGGGFDFAPNNGGPDADSTAEVMQGLVAVGQNPSAPAWTVGGHTPVSALLAFQDSATGGFFYQPGQTPDDFTTSEVPAGLAQHPYGAGTEFAAGHALPAAPAPTPTPSPSPTPSPTPTASPVATATPSHGLLGIPGTGGAAVVTGPDPAGSPVGVALAVVGLVLGGVALTTAGIRRTARRRR